MCFCWSGEPINNHSMLNSYIIHGYIYIWIHTNITYVYITISLFTLLQALFIASWHGNPEFCRGSKSSFVSWFVHHSCIRSLVHSSVHFLILLLIQSCFDSINQLLSHSAIEAPVPFGRPCDNAKSDVILCHIYVIKHQYLIHFCIILKLKSVQKHSASQVREIQAFHHISARKWMCQKYSTI